tara:strand:- start:4713 stop:7787 length:3075 start_codon:yes stop_codon:yes gene_type:complete
MVLNNAPNTGAFYFDNATEAGKSYQVKFTISEYSSGGIRIRFPEDADRVYNADGNYTAIITANTPTNATRLTFTIVGTTTLKVDNVFVKEITSPPLAAFSLRKLGKVSPYACRIRRSSDNTEAQVEFAGSAVSEFSRVRNTSQNIIAYSEDFSHSEWVKSNASVLKSLITDPFGGTNAWRFKEANSSSNSKLLVESVAVSDATSYTYSVHAKKGELDVLQMFLGNINYRGGANHANFDLTNGTVTATGGGISANIEAVGTDGWYRCSITATTDQAGNTEASLVLQSSTTASRNLAYSGNGSNGIYLFGAMLEETPNYSNEGTEIVNDDFSANTTGWTTSVGVGIDSSASIIDGVLKVNVVNNGYVRATKSITYDQNKYYILTATVNGTAGKAIRFRDDSGDLGGLTDGFDPPTGAGGKVDGRVTMTGSSQQVSFTWIPTAQSDEIIIERHSSGTYEFTVDDLLIKEYDPLYQDDFTTDTSWITSESGSSTVTIPSNGKALLTIDSGDYASMSKNLTYSQGCRYRVTATINGSSGNTVRFRDTFNTGGGLQANATGKQTEGKVTLNGSDQDISLDFTSTSASDRIIFERDGFSGNGTCTIDNLIVQKLVPSTSDYISTPVLSNDGLTFTETTLGDFVGGENLIPYSEDFNNNAWNPHLFGGAAQIVESNITDPFGGTGSHIFTSHADGIGSKIQDNITTTAGKHFISVFLKKGTTDSVQLGMIDQGTTSIRVEANLTNGTTSTALGSPSDVSIEAVGTDGWYRVSFAYTFPAGGSDTFQLYSGSSSSTGDNFYVFGYQVNTNSLKTYQKTTGTARDGNASVVVLYNQTGGEDIIQPTSSKQPLLYKGGVLVKANSSPAIQFDGTDDVMKFSPDEFGNGLNLNSLSSFLVFKADYIAGFDYVFNLGTATNDKDWFLPFINSGDFVVRYGTNSNSGTTGNTNVNLFSGVAGLQSGKFKAFLNGTQTDIRDVENNSSDTGIASLGGLDGTTNQFEGKILELIVFDTEQHTTRQEIEADIAKHHNITLS